MTDKREPSESDRLQRVYEARLLQLRYAQTLADEELTRKLRYTQDSDDDDDDSDPVTLETQRI